MARSIIAVAVFFLVYFGCRFLFEQIGYGLAVSEGDAAAIVISGIAALRALDAVMER